MSTIQVNMHEAKSRLSELAERVWAGDKVVIARAGKPYLDLLPHQAAPSPRQPGCLKGKLVVPEDFDQTSQDIIDGFEGGTL
ncbi:MAG: type II toxin-antitoxin system Phd/YefM family antitoxin [Fluviicoccus sp.]|uniref:type II toxin-antitoxin system Phd/YefM family antitoxin n=1 Tax=Fluviicoccus sp. TaxID=2003552 RepID=UPI002722B5B8|nr:type II toxin-antitoxin system Phd/YefM family antitoxin [Fluviicoccus sp.]MDO8329102.1 type II toxin-antitoxin system Phd/YefM family antitoxin [Fluviicoccus sp.]